MKELTGCPTCQPLKNEDGLIIHYQLKLHKGICVYIYIHLYLCVYTLLYMYISLSHPILGYHGDLESTQVGDLPKYPKSGSTLAGYFSTLISFYTHVERTLTKLNKRIPNVS